MRQVGEQIGCFLAYVTFVTTMAKRAGQNMNNCGKFQSYPSGELLGCGHERQMNNRFHRCVEN